MTQEYKELLIEMVEDKFNSHFKHTIEDATKELEQAESNLEKAKETVKVKRANLLTVNNRELLHRDLKTAIERIEIGTNR